MIRALLVFILTFVLTLPARAQDVDVSAYDRVIKTGTLRCGIMVWPPFWYLNPNTKKVTGIGADFYNEMGKILDLKFEFIEIVIGQQAQDLNSGRIDAVCNDGPYVFSAMKFVDYAKPIYFGPVYVYVRADETRFTKVGELDKPDITFVGMDGDLSVDLVPRLFPSAKIMSVPSTVDAASLMMHVTTAKADAVIIDPPSVRAFNDSNSQKLKAIDPKNPLVIYPISTSVKKGDSKMLNLLNAGTDAVYNTGLADKIIKKYDPTGMEIMPAIKPYEVPQ